LFCSTFSQFCHQRRHSDAQHLDIQVTSDTEELSEQVGIEHEHEREHEYEREHELHKTAAHTYVGTFNFVCKVKFCSVAIR
jgi:low affinity Fe/Cu permease